MNAENWAAIIGMVLIILATLFGRWHLKRHYRKQAKRLVEIDDFDIDFNEVAYSRDKDEMPPIQPTHGNSCTIRGCYGQDPNCGFREVAPLNILKRVPLDHPNLKHHMKFKRKFYSNNVGVVFEFQCMFCNEKAQIKPKQFWGKPRLSEEWMNWGKKAYDVGVDYGVLYTPLDGAMRIGEFKQPSENRTDDVTSQLMAYADHIKKDFDIVIEKIERDLGPEIPPWSPYYARRLTPDELEERRLMPKTDKNLRAAAAAVGPNPDRTWRQDKQPPPDKRWAFTEPVDTDIRKQVDDARE